MRSRANKRRRISLFKKWPYCYWCRRQLTLDGNPNGRGPVPENFATLDHLRSRLHPERQTPNPNCEERIVLACPTCNQKRSTEETRALSKEELWRRSGAYPGVGYDG